jgi:hypothetical protein
MLIERNGKDRKIQADLKLRADMGNITYGC